MHASLHVDVWDERSGVYRRWRIECPKNLSPEQWSIEDADLFAANVIRCTVSDDKHLVGTNWNWWITGSRLHVKQAGTFRDAAVSDDARFSSDWEPHTNPIDFSDGNVERYARLETHPDPR